MANVTMTLYEALSKKKILEDKVDKISPIRMCEKINSENKNSNGIDTDELEKVIKSNFDSSIAAIQNLAAIKAAINDANASTKVVIAGKEYSIANAIARFRSLDVEESIYTRMRSNITIIKNEVFEHNKKMLAPERVSSYVANVLGDSKKDEELISQVIEKYKRENTLFVFDPLNTEDMANEKLEEISKFREEIHYALTKVNCETEITVEYVD